MKRIIIITFLFFIGCAPANAPVFNPPAGTYSSDQSVTISSTEGATIYYTTDNSTPTTSSAVYSGPISVAGHGTTMTLKAFAVKEGMLDSSIVSATYVITYSQVSTPQFSPPAGTYSSDQSVMVSSTEGATIYYTTDNSTPTTSSAVYSGPISVAGHGTTMTLKAFAVKEGMLDSSIVSATYVITYSQVSTPQFSPPAGTYSSDQSVMVSSTEGATIYYTTDNSTPTTSSAVYSGPISVAGHGTITLRAFAVKAGMLDSSEASATYVFPTVVGGIINADTTWRKADSPFTLSADVQVAYGSRLTVEAGCDITGNEKALRSWGEVVCSGTVQMPISVSNLHIVPEGDMRQGQDFYIELTHVRILGGSLCDLGRSGDWQGSLNVSDSLFSGIPDIYLGSPDAMTKLRRNYFRNSGGVFISAFSLGIAPDVYIENNYFEQNAGSYAVEIRDLTGGAPIYVQYNTFSKTDRIAIGYSWLGSEAPNLDATQNYWNTADPAIIQSMIFDQNDDLSNPSVINYSPFLSAPDASTPSPSDFGF